MFPADSGIYEFLEEFNKHAICITTYKSKAELYSEVAPNKFVDSTDRKIQSLNWVLNSMDPLHAKLEPYLNFHKL